MHRFSKQPALEDVILRIGQWEKKLSDHTHDMNSKRYTIFTFFYTAIDIHNISLFILYIKILVVRIVLLLWVLQKLIIWIHVLLLHGLKNMNYQLKKYLHLN